MCPFPKVDIVQGLAGVVLSPLSTLQEELGLQPILSSCLLLSLEHDQTLVVGHLVPLNMRE